VNEYRAEWVSSARELTGAVEGLGFPPELGMRMAEQLGSPKAMQRMISYLYTVKPGNVELIVDEMLAICSETDAWKRKKEGQEANSKYTEMLNYGLDEDE